MRIGRYTVEGELARGGTAVVYRVRDPQGQPRALKLLHAESELALRRFEVEVGAVARLRHEHVVPVLDWGRDRRPFLVMPLVTHGTLEQRLAREGPLPEPAATRIAHQLALALAYAHGCGVSHRDLKPDNVLLDERGRALLTDFSLALDEDLQRSRLTQTGNLQGTPGYWAPEQCAAATRETPGSLTDVYGLGATLYAMLTGAPPYGATVQAMLQVTSPEPPPRVSAARPDVAPELEAICSRCLAKDPGDRFPDMDALARALGAVGQGAPRPPSRRRRPLVIGLALALLAGLGALGVWALRTPPDPLRVAARESLQRVNAHCDAGDSTAAANELTRLLADHPQLQDPTPEYAELVREVVGVQARVIEVQRLELEQRIEGLLVQARAALAAGDLDEAESDLGFLLSVAPESAAVQAFEAELERSQEAAALERRQEVERAASAPPPDPRAELSAALARGDTRGALAWARAVLEVDPGHVNARYLLLDRALTESRWVEAEEHASAMLGGDVERSQRVIALIARHQARSARGDLEGARADLDAWIELEPSAEAYLRRARLRYRSDPEGCLADLKRMHQLDPSRSNAYELGYHAVRLKEPQLAVDVLEPIAREDPGYRDVLSQLAYAYLELGRLEDSERTYSQEVARGGKHAGTFWGRAQARMQLGRLEGALEDYERIRELDPSVDEAHLAVPVLLRALGREEAPARLREVAERYREGGVDGLKAVLLAQIRDAIGDEAGALQALHGVKRIGVFGGAIDKGYFGAWLQGGLPRYGRHCLEEGQAKRGRDVLEVWLEHFPDDPRAPEVRELAR